MSLKIKKNTPLIDQHDKNFMYGGKFGGNYIPETLKKPIDDLTRLFSRLRKDKNICFVNATVQILYSIKDVRELFQSVDTSNFPPAWPICKELCRLFNFTLLLNY